MFFSDLFEMFYYYNFCLRSRYFYRFNWNQR